MAFGDETERTTRARLPVGLIVSLVLHAGLVLLLARPAPPSPPQEDPGIRVEIIPAEAPIVAAPVATPPPTPPSPSPAPTAPAAPGVPTPRLATPPSTTPPSTTPAQPSPPAANTVPPGWTAADKLVSAQRLAEPRNRAVAKHIAAMPAELRDEQLCDFEAVEQASKPGKPADQAIAYAFSEPQQAPGEITAEGAAVRIAGAWYQFAFRCRVAGTPAAVTAFAYRLGKPIPRRLWEEYGLAAGGDD